ncbi:RE1 [Symbiodinium sp. KB8]|nr:RE1 [Symbiodinium sp. KB8]
MGDKDPFRDLTFTGSPSEYRLFRRKILLSVASLEEKHVHLAGPRILSRLSGEAWRATEHLSIGDVRSEKGWLCVLRALDDHYRYLPETELNECVDEFLFHLKRRAHEGPTAFVSRFKAVLNRLESLVASEKAAQKGSTKRRRAANKKDSSSSGSSSDSFGSGPAADEPRLTKEKVEAASSAAPAATTRTTEGPAPDSKGPRTVGSFVESPKKKPPSSGGGSHYSRGTHKADEDKAQRRMLENLGKLEAGHLRVRPIFPEVILGHLFMRKYGLTREQRSQVIRSTGGSCRFKDVEKVIRASDYEDKTADPHGRGSAPRANRSGNVMAAEEDSSLSEPSLSGDEVCEAEDESADTEDREELEEAYEVQKKAKQDAKKAYRNYKDSRKRVREIKKDRQPYMPVVAIPPPTSAPLPGDGQPIQPTFKYDRKTGRMDKAKGGGKRGRREDVSLVQSELVTEFSYMVTTEDADEHDVYSVTVPAGLAVIDTGCTTSVIGEETAARYTEYFRNRGLPEPVAVTLPPVQLKGFNGLRTATERGLRWTVKLGSLWGQITTYMVEGSAPFLLSRKVLQGMEATLDLGKCTLTSAKHGLHDEPLAQAGNGHLLLPLVPPDEAEEVTNSDLRRYFQTIMKHTRYSQVDVGTHRFERMPKQAASHHMYARVAHLTPDTDVTPDHDIFVQTDDEADSERESDQEGDPDEAKAPAALVAEIRKFRVIETKYNVLTAVDYASDFSQQIVLPAGPGVVSKAFHAMWCRPYGPPRVIYVDPDQRNMAQRVWRTTQRPAEDAVLSERDFAQKMQVRQQAAEAFIGAHAHDEVAFRHAAQEFHTGRLAEELEQATPSRRGPAGRFFDLTREPPSPEDFLTPPASDVEGEDNLENSREETTRNVRRRVTISDAEWERRAAQTSPRGGATIRNREEADPTAVDVEHPADKAPRLSPEDLASDLDLEMYVPSPAEEQFPEILGPDAGAAPSAAAGEPLDNPAQEPLPSDAVLCCEVALDIFDVDLDPQGNGLWKALEECAVVAARPGQKRRVEVSFRKLGPEDREKFRGAMKKEWQSWLENKVTTIAKGKGVPKSRIIGSRWVLTWKKSSDPDDRTLSAKARLVLVGFQDPDLGRIAIDSPTLRKESKHVILSICASKGWVIWGADIKTAFLSGDQSDRQLYFRPPPEVRELMNLSDDDVLRLNKAAYGLAEAPRAWFLRLTRELLAVGLTVSQLDPCVFCLRDNGTNELVGICGVHVDDLLGGGTSVMDQCLVRLKIKLPFGEFRQRTIKYTGAEIRQHPDFSIEVTQEAYVDKLEEVSTKPFGKASDFLNEPTLMRACCGQLAWVANHSRPDQTFLASYLQGIQDKALVSHLDLYNKAVREMKARKVSLRFPPVPVDRWRLLAITDAGWGVRANGESQGGLLLCLCDKDVLEQKPGKTWIIEWSSKKLRRVVRSSTAAETLAAQNGLDSIEFAQAFLQEVLFGMSPRQFQQWVPETQSGLVIDSKSLYDALTRSACSSALAMEKRLAIDYAIARACLAERNVLPFWTNNLQMISDCLTKLRGNKEILYKESGRKETARKKGDRPS